MNTLRVGSTGPDVARWQSLIGVTADGIFGIATENATKRWQSSRGLASDGVVGPASWAAALIGGVNAAPASPQDITETAFVGARGVDSYPFSTGGTKAQADALAASGVEFFVGYLGSMGRERLGYILDAGLAFMPVTLANRFSGEQAARQCQALGITPGCTVWLDVEGMAVWKMDPTELIGKINAWAEAVAAAGYMPGIYVGAPQPLTSKELGALKVVRYWWGLGRCVDRTGALAEPPSGWCMIQQFHGQKTGFHWRDTGVFVDTNGVQCDYRGRLPAWMKRAV